MKIFETSFFTIMKTTLHVDDYDNADKYAEIQRKQMPGIYKPRRFYEKPIPNTNQPGPSISQTSSSQTTNQSTVSNEEEINEGNLSVVTNERSGSNEEMDPLADLDPFQTIGPQNANVQSNGNYTDTKSFLNNDTASEDIDELLNARVIEDENDDDDDDDDIEITYQSEDAFKPILSQLLLKRNDEFSGNIPYEEDVSIKCVET